MCCCYFFPFSRFCFTYLLSRSYLVLQRLLARCLIYAWARPAHPYSTQLSIVWVRSFIVPYLFDNNVPFDNTIPIYLIRLLWKLGLGLGLDLELHYFSIFHGQQQKRASYLPQILR